jgi:uncharacterized protein
MLCAARWALATTLLAGWLVLPSAAHAINPQVHDQGKFFSPDTIKKADAELKRIEEKYKKDVVVETYGSIPEDIFKRYSYDEKNRDAFFDKWATDLEEKAGANGILILLSKDQFKEGRVRVEIGVGKETQKKWFTIANRNEVRDMLKAAVKSALEEKDPRKYDQGLMDALRHIDNTMAAHKVEAAAPPIAQQKPAPQQAPTTTHHDSGGPNILGWICIGLCVLLGIWLVVGLIRAFSGYGYGGGGYGYGGGGYGYGGGGGFFAGLMGGLFGAMAGNWIYNNMFGGSSYRSFESSAHASEPMSGPRDDVGPSDQGQGFSNTGGDVEAGGGGGGDW